MATIKKPAAKKAPAKKPAAKKAPVKKAATKKPAAKKTAAKKTPAKKPAVKAAPKKAAVKKPATKKAVSAKKAPAKKPAAKAAPVKKVAPKPAAKPVAKPVEVSDVPFRNLFDAYHQGKLPFSQGYIVSSFFNESSLYSIYEIVSYSGVKEIFLTEAGLQFVTGGKKLYILVEPDTYPIKFQEPVSRAEGEKIPKRFDELDTLIAKNQSRIHIAKEPNESFGSFTVLKPSENNFAVVFYQTPNMYTTLAEFFVESLNRQRKVPEHDAKAAAIKIIDILKKQMSFEGEYK